MKVFKTIFATILVILSSIVFIAVASIRFLIIAISLLASLYFFVMTIILSFGVIVGNHDWNIPLTHYFWYFICALVYGLMDEIEQKIYKERLDIMLPGCLINLILDLYLFIFIAHYEIPKKLIMKVLGISKTNKTETGTNIDTKES